MAHGLLHWKGGRKMAKIRDHQTKLIELQKDALKFGALCSIVVIGHVSLIHIFESTGAIIGLTALSICILWYELGRILYNTVKEDWEDEED